MKTHVKVDLGHTACDHCGKTNQLIRTFRIAYPGYSINVGVRCAEKYFDVRMRGNPYQAASRLRDYLASLDEDVLYDILDSLSENK